MPQSTTCKAAALVLALALFPLGACADGKSNPASAAKPEVAERYQRGFDSAWERAEQGRSPSGACAQVIGTVVGEMQQELDDKARAEALHAADACYVRAMVRFLEKRLDAIEAGEANCIGPVSSTSIHRSSLGGFIEDLGESRAEFDGRIAAAVGDRVRAACPDAAAVILGEQ